MSRNFLVRGRREKKLGREYSLTGLHRRPADMPGRPYGEVAVRIGVRPGALKNLVVTGQIEAIQNGIGGIYFTNEQESAAVPKCYELGLVTD